MDRQRIEETLGRVIRDIQRAFRLAEADGLHAQRESSNGVAPAIRAMHRRGQPGQRRRIHGEESLLEWSTLLDQGMRSKISLGDDQQVSKDGDEGFPAADVERLEERLFGEQRETRQAGLPAAVVDRALLGDERGAFLEKGLQRVGGRNRLRPQALAQVTPNAGDSTGTGRWER